MTEEICNWKDLGDVDKRMSRLMHRFLMEAAGFRFHGAVILAPECPKCGALHDWRMTTDISSKEGEGPTDAPTDGEREAALAMLEDMAAAIRTGRHASRRIDMRSSSDA
jgi:hypothetical protein